MSCVLAAVFLMSCLSPCVSAHMILLQLLLLRGDVRSVFVVVVVDDARVAALWYIVCIAHRQNVALSHEPGTFSVLRGKEEGERKEDQTQTGRVASQRGPSAVLPKRLEKRQTRDIRNRRTKIHGLRSPRTRKRPKRKKNKRGENKEKRGQKKEKIERAGRNKREKEKGEKELAHGDQQTCLLVLSLSNYADFPLPHDTFPTKHLQSIFLTPPTPPSLSSLATSPRCAFLPDRPVSPPVVLAPRSFSF